MDANDVSSAEIRRLRAGDDPHALDEDTAERLLSGRLDPADVPPDYAEVAALLAAAGAEPSPEELAGAPAAVAELASATRARSAAAAARWARRRRRAGLAIAIVVGALLAGGVAAAATGHLSEPIREAVRTILTTVGVTTPGPPAEPAPSTTEAGAGGVAGDGQGTRPTGAANHGQRTPDPTGGPAAAGAPTERLCGAFVAGHGVRQESDGAAFQTLAAASGADKTAGDCQETLPPGTPADHGQGQNPPPGTPADHGQGQGQGQGQNPPPGTPADHGQGQNPPTDPASATAPPGSQHART